MNNVSLVASNFYTNMLQKQLWFFEYLKVQVNILSFKLWILAMALNWFTDENL